MVVLLHLNSIIISPFPNKTFIFIINTQVCRNDAVTFTNNSSPKGLKFDASWDFGDGGSATGNKVKHTYISNGYYNITLTVSLTDGTCKKTLSFPMLSIFWIDPRRNS
jgi:PKD repeat protein